MTDKIQTGVRVPEAIHTDLQARAERMGVSVNQLILILISLGLRLIDEGTIPPSEQEYTR